MNKKSYKELVSNDSNTPIFYKPWYLDAVCGSAGWNACVSYLDEKRWGILPFVIDEKFGVSAVCVPPLTQYAGPFIHIDKSINSPRRFSIEARIMQSLLDDVCTYGDYYAQKWGPWQNNWLPAYHSKFVQSSRMTYIIKGNCNYSDILSGYSSQVRNKLNNNNRIIIYEGNNPDLLYDMAVSALKKYQKEPKYTYTKLFNLINVASSNNGGKQLTAFSEKGEPLASAFFLEDKNYIYYYIAGEYLEHRGKNAPTLLIDKGIQMACAEKKTFDFTGSMMPSLSRFYQSFGPQIFNYHMITKDNRKNTNTISSELLNRTFLFRF